MGAPGVEKTFLNNFEEIFEVMKTLQAITILHNEIYSKSMKSFYSTSRVPPWTISSMKKKWWFCK
jgi:hypothetical protein